jgi:hypothetical protein
LVFETTTTTTPSPTTIDGSTIKVTLVDKGIDWKDKPGEARKWKDDLLGTPTKPVTPSAKGFAQKLKDFPTTLSPGDRAVLATASEQTAKRLRKNESSKVQDVLAMIFSSEAIMASVDARGAANALVNDFYTDQSWKPGDSLDDANRRSTLAKFFEDLAQALKQ